MIDMLRVVGPIGSRDEVVVVYLVENEQNA